MKQTVEEFLIENQYIQIPVALGYILDRSELFKGLPIVNKGVDMLIYFELYHEIMQAHARLQDEHGFIRLKEVIEDIGNPTTDSLKGKMLMKLIGCECLFYLKPTDSTNTDYIIQPVFDPDRLKGFKKTVAVIDACEEKDFAKLLMTVPNRIPDAQE